MHKAFGADSTIYYEERIRELITDRAQERGVQMRSIQYAIQRVKDDPDFAKYAILKPGPLDMDKAYLAEMADVYKRGLMEVEHWIQKGLENENAN